MQFIGVVWCVYATGYSLLLALAFAMCFIYAQVTVNDFVIARYTADAWRSRVYAVRYFITYLISGAAITMIAVLYGRGGFDLVLGVTAMIACGFVIGTAGIAFLVNGSRAPTQRGAAGGIVFLWRMIFFRKPVPTFRDHALNSGGIRSSTLARMRFFTFATMRLRWHSFGSRS